MSIESVMPSSNLILCHPLLLLPPIPPSIRVFSSESTLCMRWPKYWSFSFSIIPSKEIPGLISFRMDWLYLLIVQRTLKSLLQYHSSKASILRRSAFFTVQLSHPYMTTGKTIALSRWTFVGKVMSLLLNMLSRLVITFLPRGKRLLISWLQSPSAVLYCNRFIIVFAQIRPKKQTQKQNIFNLTVQYPEKYHSTSYITTAFVLGSRHPGLEIKFLCSTQPTYACTLSRVSLSVTPWTVGPQAPLSMEFSRQEYWSGVPLPVLQGIFLTQGSNPSLLCLLHWPVDSLPLNHVGNPTPHSTAQ